MAVEPGFSMFGAINVHIMRSLLLTSLSVFLLVNLSSCTVEGCTNPFAENFDIDANQDDGSCLIEGCTNPLAPNYNEDANVEDGSCDPIPCPQGQEATLTITNLTVCTPDIRVNGEVVIFDFGNTPTGPYGAVAELELGEGTNIIQADLTLITLCLERDTTLEAVCGEEYTWNFY